MAITVSVMQGGSNNHVTTSEEANGIATDFVAEGVIGSTTNTSGVAPMTGAYSVNAQGTPDMTVAVGSGIAYVTGTPSSQNSQTFRVYNSASENVTISANSSGSTKYDWVYIQLDATLLANPTLAGTTTATLVTSRSTSSTTDNGTPPTYGYPLAVVTVINGATSITNSSIRDLRSGASIGNSSVNATGWIPSQLPAVSSVTYNGNRSYDITFASTVASLLSPGMKIRTTRTVTAPTQCTSLNGTTQYWVKTSPNKLTFTDDFVVSAWVKVSAYQNSIIVSRYNGTSGWYLNMQADGTILLNGLNAGAANFSYVKSYQSLPLNKWVHITAQLDMSAFTATTTTSYIMFDGIDIPATVVRGGTNPTALIQAGNLEIGSFNGGTVLFSGKIAQVAIYNAKVTQATIRTSISQGLSGSETSLASAYSFNNSTADLNTTTPNDLSAGAGSPTATNADSPFAEDASGTPVGTYDYALVMKVSTTTATVQVPEGCAIPTSGGVFTVDIAPSGNPFGFTLDKGRWEVGSYQRARATQSTPVAGTWYNVNSPQLTVPVGRWNVRYQCVVVVVNATNAPAQMVTLSKTSSSSQDDTDYTARAVSTTASANSVDHTFYREKDTSLDTATLYYLNTQSVTASATSIAFAGEIGTTKIYAIPAGI